MSIARNRRGVRTALLGVLYLALSGCGAAHSHSDVATQAPALELKYIIPAVDGGVIESSRNTGRVTVLLFVTTFDVYSQAQAMRLEDLFRSHEPRINAVAIVMEPPKNIQLVRSFIDVLRLSYSVGMADHQELERQGLLGQIQSVPAWVFLNARGQVVNSGLGGFSMTELERTVVQAER
jgi:hypothetical protein